MPARTLLARPLVVSALTLVTAVPVAGAKGGGAQVNSTIVTVGGRGDRNDDDDLQYLERYALPR